MGGIRTENDKDFYVSPGIGEEIRYMDRGGTIGTVRRPNLDTFIIEIELGQTTIRSKKYEKRLSTLPGFERAHAVGPILGHESPHAVFLTGKHVNQKIQRLGIEDYIKNIGKNKEGELYLTVTVTRKREIIKGRSYDFLKEITYTIHSIQGRTNTRLFESGFEVLEPAKPDSKIKYDPPFESKNLTTYLEPKSLYKSKGKRITSTNVSEKSQLRPLDNSTLKWLTGGNRAGEKPPSVLTFTKGKPSNTTFSGTINRYTAPVNEVKKYRYTSQRGTENEGTLKKFFKEVEGVINESGLKKLWEPVSKGSLLGLKAYSLFDAIFTFQELEGFIYHSLSKDENREIAVFKKHIDSAFLTENLDDYFDKFDFYEELIYSVYREKKWPIDVLNDQLKYAEEYLAFFKEIQSETGRKIDMFPKSLIDISKSRSEFLMSFAADIEKIIPYMGLSTLVLADAFVVKEKIKYVGACYSSVYDFLDKKYNGMLQQKTKLDEYHYAALNLFESLKEQL